jgi:hypothetical protein
MGAFSEPTELIEDQILVRNQITRPAIPGKRIRQAHLRSPDAARRAALLIRGPSSGDQA